MIKYRIEYFSKGSGHLEWPDPQNTILVPNIKALPNLPT
jgi:hypothetical protein